MIHIDLYFVKKLVQEILDLRFNDIRINTYSLPTVKVFRFNELFARDAAGFLVGVALSWIDRFAPSRLVSVRTI